MNSTDRLLGVLLAVVALILLIRISEANDCDLCGRECVSACGTKMFRVCCFNYNRKRSNMPPLWMPRSKIWEGADDPLVLLQHLAKKSSGKSLTTTKDSSESRKKEISEDKALQFLWRNND
uniref:U-scoloptoxin(20)-Cw1a n=1 Tax=Cormocephalus westwoodi TaxID=1096223 RepID=TXK1A_CORWE|nr:RecName: Full=U-scoloptoxin(20)-Cw1a; Short=U-SLPTX(20)-Cw1a; Flags: Precursor [Cormocephalus westwoodi]